MKKVLSLRTQGKERFFFFFREKGKEHLIYHQISFLIRFSENKSNILQILREVHIITINLCV